jgi:hypothetical protein
MVSAPARRQQVAYAMTRGLPSRTACALMQVSRSTLSYAAKQPAMDALALNVMRALAAQYPRFGYRRIHVYMGREGHDMGIDRAHRLWQLGGCRCRGSARASDLQQADRDRCRRRARTRSGPTTSFSMLAPMGSS